MMVIPSSCAAGIRVPRRSRSGFDSPEFEELEAQRLDLPDNAEHRRAILKQTGEHGVAAQVLRDHRGKGRLARGSKPALDSDRVQTRRCDHTVIMRPGLVSRRRLNLVIVRMPMADRADHRDPAMTRHPEAGHDPRASYRHEENESHVEYR
jgi:hypothetical protein